MQNGLLPQLEIPVHSGDWYFVFTLVSVVLFVAVRWLNPRYFSRLLQATISNYEAFRLITEKNIRMQQAVILLFLLSSLTLSLFWMVQATTIPTETHDLPFLPGFLVVFLMILTMMTLRMLLVRLCGDIFHIRELTRKLNQIWIVQIHILGISLGFIVVLFPYLPVAGPEITTIAGYLMLMIWAIYNIFRQLQLLTQNRISLFYRFLYLCAFEILPWWWIVEITIKGWSE